MAGESPDTQKPFEDETEPNATLATPAGERGLFPYSIGVLSCRPAVILKRFGGPHFRHPRAPQDRTRISLAGSIQPCQRTSETSEQAGWRAVAATPGPRQIIRFAGRRQGPSAHREAVQ
jgi:hypothetical protein